MQLLSSHGATEERPSEIRTAFHVAQQSKMSGRWNCKGAISSNQARGESVGA
jgi:hypothetical protein